MTVLTHLAPTAAFDLSSAVSSMFRVFGVLLIYILSLLGVS